MKLSVFATVFLAASPATVLFERLPDRAANSYLRHEPSGLLGDDFAVSAPGTHNVATIRTWFGTLVGTSLDGLHP